ncbi:MAG: hypothetical protein DME23_10800 [Verrucomicrobia bacterium]|nr:MAG: hypothetical protein DME23_10800 [Verrucomicrobiota bacterium]
MNHATRQLSARFAVTVLSLLSGLFTVFASAPGDEHWDNQFGPVGASDQLWAAAAVGGKVYVGGLLTAAGNTKANFIAGYDGTNWFPLNNGVSGGLNTTYIFALASDGTNVYAGGWFTNADNSGARYLARWDGNSWSPLAGGNPNSIVEAIKISGTNMFVGGVFTTNGGVQVNGIARWDGSNWNPFGSGVTGSFTPVVVAIEYDGANLYVGGRFTQAGTVNATNIAQWNGTTWLPMGNGFAGSVLALARYGGYLYAGGDFTDASLAITNLAKWDGSAWSAVGTGANQTVRDLLSDGANLYVGGDFTEIDSVTANRIVKWDGANWLPLGDGVQGFGAGAAPGVYKMALDAKGRLFIAGNFNQVSGVGVSHVAGWDGTSWFALGGTTSKGMTHFLGQVHGLFSDGTNVYAGGDFTEAGKVIVNGFAQWNRTNWSALGSVVNGQQPAVTAGAFTSGGGYLFAGGSFTNVGGTPAGRIAQWDGSQWNNVGDADGTVRALAYDGNYVWAGGIFTNIGGVYSPALAVLSIGSGWFSLGSPSGGGAVVNAIAWDGTYVYVGGNFTSMGGVSATNIARFDGSTWSSLGNGVNTTVNAIALTNGVVYAGGSFTSASGVSANRVARWDGSAWSALGSGLTGSGSSATVSALAVDGNEVYAVGSFTNAGGIYTPGIAKWNGTSWSTLGSGLYFSISAGAGSGKALTLMGNDLFVGGAFSSAGDKPSMFIARWNDRLNFYPPPHPLLTREAWLSNGLFRFRFTGTSGESYILQGSTDLSTWTPLLTNSITLYDFTDALATNYDYRFYRAVLAP